MATNRISATTTHSDVIDQFPMNTITRPVNSSTP